MTCSIDPSMVEITEDQQGVEVYAYNATSKKIVVMKSSDDGIVEGFKFRLMGNGYNQTVTTDASGMGIFYNVPNGYYVLIEEDIPDRYFSWNNVVREFVLTDEDMAMVVHAHNSLKRGNLHIVKSTDDGTLRGFRFYLHGESWFEGPVDLYAETDGNGDAWFRNVPFGDGYILEEVDVPDNYIAPDSVSVDIHDAVASPWDEYTVQIQIHNPSKPKVQDLAVLKFTDDGRIEGFGFQVTGTTLVGEALERYTDTDEYGVALFDSLPYGSYILEETSVPEGYEKHAPVSFTIGEEREFCASIGPVWDISGGSWGEGKDSWGVDAASLAAFEGRLIDLYGYGYPTDHTVGIVIYDPSSFAPGKITVQKIRSDTGKAAADAEFILEWSEDGEAWTPVFFTEESGVVGGCTSEGLTDGKLVTGEDGFVIFEGLHPAVYYRLTETKAPAGMQLLTTPAFEGKLPDDDGFELAMNVVNSPILKLPMTGGQPGGALRTAWRIWSLITAGFAAVVICPVLVRKIKQNSSKRKEK